MKTQKRRLIPVAVALVAVIAVSGVAYAYWTASGSGGGSAAVANPVSTVTVHQTTGLNAMYPGDIPQTITGNFINANSGPVYVGTVTASISSVTGGAGACGASDFLLNNLALTGATATVNAEVPVGNPELTVTWTGITIQFNDKGTPQDGCKGATVNLSFTIS